MKSFVAVQFMNRYYFNLDLVYKVTQVSNIQFLDELYF